MNRRAAMRKQGGIMRLLKLVALAALAAVAAGTAQADAGPPWGPETPNFNLQAVLRPAAGGPDDGFGLVKFRQPNDGERSVLLGVWVRNLAPDTDYYLERATDPTVDDNCTGTNWVTLGQGLTTVAIETDDTGSGRAALFRNLGTTPIGTEFDIHFRVIQMVGNSKVVVLASGCYQFTVSQ
jgi:hypothetical protein